MVPPGIIGILSKENTCLVERYIYQENYLLFDILLRESFIYFCWKKICYYYIYYSKRFIKRMCDMDIFI